MSGHSQEIYTMAVLAAGTALLDLTKTPLEYATAIFVIVNTSGLVVTLMDGSTLSLQNPAMGVLIPIRCKAVQTSGVANSVIAMR